MKKFFKTAGATVLMGAMLIGITGCKVGALEPSEEIMQTILDADFKDLDEYLDEDDDLYDEQLDLLKEMEGEGLDWDDLFEDATFKYQTNSLKQKGDSTSLTFDIDLDGDDYEFEITLVEDDGEFYIKDNEKFLVSVMELYFDAMSDSGNSKQKSQVKSLMEYYDTKKPAKLAQMVYDFEVGNSSNK